MTAVRSPQLSAQSRFHDGPMTPRRHEVVRNGARYQCRACPWLGPLEDVARHVVRLQWTTLPPSEAPEAVLAPHGES